MYSRIFDLINSNSPEKVLDSWRSLNFESRILPKLNCLPNTLRSQSKEGLAEPGLGVVPEAPGVEEPPEPGQERRGQAGHQPDQVEEAEQTQKTIDVDSGTTAEVSRVNFSPPPLLCVNFARASPTPIGFTKATTTMTMRTENELSRSPDSSWAFHCEST